MWVLVVGVVVWVLSFGFLAWAFGCFLVLRLRWWVCGFGVGVGFDCVMVFCGGVLCLLFWWWD